jgi:hypothetical protein
MGDNTAPTPTMQPGGTPGSGNDPDKYKITKLEWDKTKTLCGDEVKLSIETENLDGMTILLAAVRPAKERQLVDLIKAPISGEKSNPAWIAYRGPHQPEVKLKAKAAGLGAPKDSSNQLEVQGVADVVEPPSATASPPSKGRRFGYPTQMISVPGRPGPEWVKAPGTTRYRVDFEFERQIKDGVLIITRKIAFAPKRNSRNGRAAPTLTAKKMRKWRRDIHAVWSMRFKLHRVDCKRGQSCDCSTCGGCSFPVRIVCEWGAGHGQAINVFPGAWDRNTSDAPWDTDNWWESASTAIQGDDVRAHEFGHLLGLYDEYSSGAVDPAATPAAGPNPPRIDNTTSIMGYGHTALAYHFEEFKVWFEQKAPHVGKLKIVRNR